MYYLIVMFALLKCDFYSLIMEFLRYILVVLIVGKIFALQNSAFNLS